MQFRCLICGYIHTGDAPPRKCPIYAASSDQFEPYAQPTPEIVAAATSPDIQVLIIGSGIAGLACAEELRQHSPTVRITLISAEPHLPYYRLNLTRYLAREINESHLPIYPAAWYEEQRIELLLDQAVIGIDRTARQVLLADGGRRNYDKLVLATGAGPFVPPIPGSQLPNVLTVRTIDDARRILDQVQPGEPLLCIGGGILGLETAGALARGGASVTLLEAADYLMPAQLNRNAAACLRHFVADLGIAVREGVRIEAIVGQEQCEGIRLAGGEILAARYVLITAGVRPNLALARSCGLTVHKGLVVDDLLRTADADIFAAGDVVEHNGQLYGLWQAAQYQGKIAARNVLGLVTRFGGIPRSNVLKVLGLDLFSIGEFNPAAPGDVFLEEETADGYLAFNLRQGLLKGSIVIGDKILAGQVRQAIDQAVMFAPADCTDIAAVVARLQALR